jgi:uncharacterized protein|tara:strand:+ start:194 stop:388 length:195 start_codon:yes stop_codon:yes gene_type:complete
MDIIKSIKLRMLRKERDQIKANRKVWIEKHKNSLLNQELARVFTAYQSKINQLSMAISKVKQDL